LNPLLNPVLGQNMGRWAEVYFTSPPEKREQAVLELLRELQAENSPREDAFVASPSSAEGRAQPLVVTPVAEVRRTPVRCRACGRENPASHKFWGMCGRPVAESHAAADLHVSDLHIADLQPHDAQLEDPPEDELAVRVRNRESSEYAAYEPTLRTSELPLFHSGRYRDDSTDEIFHYPPASRSYRVYVGTALAVVMFALGYMAWRSMQATSQTAHVEPQAPPAITPQPAVAAPAPPSLSNTDTLDTPSANRQAVVPSQPNPESEQPHPQTRAHKAAKAVAQTIPTAESNGPPGTAGGNGAEELATAQRYLSETSVPQRNRGEAAKWLWKAVAKHNADATLLLADLYLKGQGVGKNCDQARVLLDAAARKGVKDAGQRLRHLQAFGCE
jgi:hypothetical protein